jgi:hypothetical protein
MTTVILLIGIMALLILGAETKPKSLDEITSEESNGQTFKNQVSTL